MEGESVKDTCSGVTGIDEVIGILEKEKLYWLDRNADRYWQTTRILGQVKKLFEQKANGSPDSVGQLVERMFERGVAYTCNGSWNGCEGKRFGGCLHCDNK